MRLLLLSLFAAVALSSCHLVVHDVTYRPAPPVVRPVQVVHCHHPVPPRCHVHEEYSVRWGVTRIPSRNIGPDPRPIGPPPPRSPKAKRY